ESKGGKSKRFTLFIGDEGAILIFMQGAKVVRRLFAPSAQPSHTEAMLELMHANPNVSISILADVIDQQYVPQTFPPVSSLSVGGLVSRRLERDFQPEDLKGSLQLGRDKAGRKEWKYLLIALAKTPMMTEWIDLIVEMPNEMKGIFLVPIEAANYVAMLNKRRDIDKPRPWQLLISHNKVSGFRQVVTNDGKLIFTRVSHAIDDAIPAVIAGNIEQEIINTIEYLKRLEFRDSADLEATVITSQDVVDSLDLKRFNFGGAEALTPLAVAELMKLEQAALSADRFGDVVMAAAFTISKKRILRFANAYIDKLAKLYKMRTTLKAFAALFVVALVGLTVMTFSETFSNSAGIGEARNKKVALQSDIQKLQKQVDGLNKDIAFKSVVVATYDAYLKNANRPEDFAIVIAPFVAPTSRITSLCWDLNGTSSTCSGAAGAALAAGAAPAASAALPIKIELTVDFSAVGNTLDAVDKAASSFVDSVKEKLVLYDVTVDAFPWKKEGERTEEVAVDVNNAIEVETVKDPTITLHLKGLKKGGGAVGGAPAAPAAAPGGPPPVSPPGGTPGAMPPATTPPPAAGALNE
ncbi:MAG: hypothetical protein ACOYNL_05160, partial [Rickettsiales bacterium]